MKIFKRLFISFTLFLSIISGAWADKIPYASFAGDILTFKYEEHTLGANEWNVSNTGTDTPGWPHNDRITKVVFEESFKDARPLSCQQWFYGLSKLESIEGLSYLNTSEVTNMNWMFYGCGISSLDLSSFNTTNVTRMSCMFQQCSSLEFLNLSSFDTKNVTEDYQMFQMFILCGKLKTIIVGNDWDVTNVTQSGGMFQQCTSLVGGDGTTFDSNYTDKTKAYAGEGGYLTSYAQIFAYTVSGDEVTITGFASDFDVPENYDLVIPDEIEGKPVTKIGGSAFMNNQNIKTIRVGKNVHTIESRAFYNVPISTLTFDEDSQIESIGERAFVGDWYSVVQTTTSLEFPASLKSIGDYAFSCHKTLTAITFKGKLSTISESAFQRSWNLSEVNVPLEYLDFYANDSQFKTALSKDITGHASILNAEYTLPTSSIGSFSTGTAVTLPEGLKAYYCKNYDSTAGMIATKEITGAIPANTGVLLRGDAGETYAITASSETPEAITDNALVAVTEATHVDQTDGDYTNFMMKGGKFIKIAASSNPDDKLPANRAYLPILTSALSTIGSNSIEVKWDEETSISNVNVNGNVNHKDAWYSLDGRKLNGIPAKGGVYINNGKKVVK